MYGQMSAPEPKPAKAQATACRPCAKAKVKCRYSESGGSCERCLRLKKDCFSQQLAERRAPLPRTRFAQLEHKVDSLTKELELRNQPHTSDTNLTGRCASHDPSLASSEPASHLEIPTGTALLNDPSVRLHSQSLLIPEDDLVFSFHRYRVEMAPHFPFVVIPDLPPAMFYAEKPFLFKAMVMVASYRNRPFQHQIGTQLTEEVGKRLLVDGERSLDLLQGLLIHIAWYHLHLGAVSQMTNLLQLAIALMADLGLNKPSHGTDRRKLMFDSSKLTQGAVAESRLLRNDETRALLGCFYVSSIVSAIFRRIPALGYTNYMEKQLQFLLGSNEYESDILLAQMIHIQQFAERVFEAMRYDEAEDPTIPHTPIALHLKTLRTEFRNLSMTIPIELQNNKLLRLQKCAVDVFIHENGINDSFWNPPSTTNERIDVLWTLLQGIKGFFETFLDLSPEKLFQLPYSGWGQSTYVILIFSRLSNLECPGWDPQMVHNTYDFAGLIEALIQLLGKSINYAGLHWLSGQRDPVIARALSKVKFVQTWWQNTRPGLSPSQIQPFSPDLGFSRGSVIGDDFWDELMRDCEPLQF